MITAPPNEVDATPFAAYITGYPNADELREAMQSGQLSPNAAWAHHVMEAVFDRSGEHSSLDDLRSYFGEWDDEAQTSRANVLRMRAGGTLPPPPASASPLGEPLAILARDLYPLLLLQPGGDGKVDPYRPPTWTSVVGLDQQDHPAAERFRALLEAAPAINAAISRGTLMWSERVDVGRYWAGGRCGRVLPSLHCSLLNDAFRASAALPGPLTPERVITCALSALDRLEQTLEGKPSKITVLHGLAGITLPEDSEIRVPWGLVRNLHPEETRLMDPSPGVRSSAHASASVVLEAPAIIERVASDAEPEGWFDRPTLGVGELDLIERLQLAFLIASRGAGTVTPVWCVSPAADHLSDLDAEREAYLHAPMATAVGYLDKVAEIQAVHDASDLIASQHHNSMDTAARRLLRARLERSRPDDALVDAVIALESLFAGTNQGEIRNRIGTAVAWLLAPDDPDRREERFTETKQLYDDRSGIVHGSHSKRKTTKALWGRRDDAVDLVVSCFNALYEDRPDLVARSDRGHRLCLGLAGPTPHSAPR
ncbi:HEPN domain-containing protein [Streptomyces agglomeratus]|uniref:HEPN domain-containing protein n=1 Tax=Streptomyces agglomeratus TaxID=285458 RepID=UPI00114D1CE6|nr:HEPN domain-containing protein [Streptomyces agglomeratus]